MLKNSSIADIFVLSHQNSQFKQFAISYDKAKIEYHITNPSGNGCSFVLGVTYMSMYIDVKLYDIKCQFLLKSDRDVPCFLYHLLIQFEDIEKDYLQLIERFVKLEESATIIRKWIEKHFRNSNYDYHLTEAENKILLSVPLRNKVQLSIPIYYKKYKQILPHVITTLKMYESVVTESKIKVFISEK